MSVSGNDRQDTSLVFLKQDAVQKYVIKRSFLCCRIVFFPSRNWTSRIGSARALHLTSFLFLTQSLQFFKLVLDSVGHRTFRNIYRRVPCIPFSFLKQYISRKWKALYLINFAARKKRSRLQPKMYFWKIWKYFEDESVIIVFLKSSFERQSGF